MTWTWLVLILLFICRSPSICIVGGEERGGGNLATSHTPVSIKVLYNKPVSTKVAYIIDKERSC